jgi:hypothetical protein
MPGLNAPLDQLREGAFLPQDMLTAEMPGDIRLHPDPAGEYHIKVSSPRARLLELEVAVTRPGAWLGLHVPLHLTDLSGIRWLGFAARSNAGQAIAVRACIRSGIDGGFFDVFFDKHILSQTGQTDHVDMLSPDHLPELPKIAKWREIILFLPPAHGFGWALQDLRLFAI